MTERLEEIKERAAGFSEILGVEEFPLVRSSPVMDLKAKLRKTVKKMGLEMMEEPAFKPIMIQPLKMQGVVDIKDNGIETPELIARRIEHAEKVLGPGRIPYVHPDCGFWMLQRSVADGKMRSLVKGRDLFEGRS